MASLGLPGDLKEALAVFDPAALPREPWVWDTALAMPGVAGGNRLN